MNLAHKIRIYPNLEQAQALVCACGVARFTYNYILGEWQRQYKAGEKPNVYKLKKEFNTYKGDLFPWVYESPKDCNQQPIMDLGKAFGKFFKGESKYPQFKHKGQKDSFYVSNDKASLLEDKYIRLPLIGSIRLGEKPRFEGKVVSYTVSRDVDRWFVSVCYDLPDTSNNIDNGEVVGVDLGLKDLAVLSDGTKIENLKFVKKHEKKLKHEQRKLAKKQLGSQNRKKQKIRVAKVHRTIRCQKQDYIHKFTSFLAKTKQEMVLETLQVKNMMKNHKLAKSFASVSLGELERQLQYKTKIYGSLLTQVDIFYPSSKLCHVCGFKNIKLALKDRIWTCPDCNTVHDRDFNASKNLESQAVSIKFVPKAIRDIKLVENPTPGIWGSVSRCDLMKQEKRNVQNHICTLSL